MAIFNGNNKITLSGIDKVYVGSDLVYTKSNSGTLFYRANLNYLDISTSARRETYRVVLANMYDNKLYLFTSDNEMIDATNYYNSSTDELLLPDSVADKSIATLYYRNYTESEVLRSLPQLNYTTGGTKCLKSSVGTGGARSTLASPSKYSGLAGYTTIARNNGKLYGAYYWSDIEENYNSSLVMGISTSYTNPRIYFGTTGSYQSEDNWRIYLLSQ